MLRFRLCPLPGLPTYLAWVRHLNCLYQEMLIHHDSSFFFVWFMDLYISLQTSSRIPRLDPVTRYLSLTYLFPCMIHIPCHARGPFEMRKAGVWSLGALILNIYHHGGVKWDVWMSTTLIRRIISKQCSEDSYDPPSNAQIWTLKKTPPGGSGFGVKIICRPAIRWCWKRWPQQAIVRQWWGDLGPSETKWKQLC